MTVERARLGLAVAAVAVAVAGAAGMFLLRSPQRPPLPAAMGTVADFSLRGHDGRPVRRADLLGKAWVADFIFSRCQGPCPLMTQRMAALEARFPLGDPVAFVTFSVDPEHDTPAVLASYRAARGITSARWHFLTGRRRDVIGLVTKSFLLPVGEPAESASAVELAHSERFVLVDAAGGVRGYYDSQSARELAGLHADLATLRRTTRP